ncbi:MAG TPA: hypothetical protein DEO40_06105, partial [Treponema sp.]|nr:hypothetical protein [Treponema sp.]
MTWEAVRRAAMRGWKKYPVERALIPLESAWQGSMDGDVQQVCDPVSFRTRFGIYALYLVQMLKQVQH